MSVEVIPGGQRRIDRVLAPGFAAEAAGLDLDELRARRDEAEAEEADISYLRRLLQGRLDILRAELVRRARGGDRDVAGLLAGLPAILSDEDPGTFNAVPRVLLPSRADQHRRRVERLVSDETVARLPELDADELVEAVDVLAREEAAVSASRRAVQQVVDALRSELARRYRDGTAQVSQLLE
jgi:hypothetical protein